MPPVAPMPTPEDATVNLNFVGIPGTVIFVAGVIAALLAGLPLRRTARLFGDTIVQMTPSLLAISFMVALAYVTRYSGMDTILGLSLTGTGWLFPFFGTLLGWLGVALTGTDAGSNALFGNLQKVTAEQLQPESDPDGRRQYDRRRDGQDDRCTVHRRVQFGNGSTGQRSGDLQSRLLAEHRTGVAGRRDRDVLRIRDAVVSFHEGSSMKRTRILIGTFAAVLVSTMSAAQAPTSDVDAHIATAKAAAGQDYRATFVNLCLPTAPRAGGPGAAGRGAAPAGRAAGGPATPDRTGWYASPYKVFDNFYWLGTRQHSSWALRTSEGIILIDTNFAWATQPEIIDGLTTLGLDPRDIKYVIISHAHGDHDQGAAELQRRYGAKVVMGAADWESTLQRPATAAGGVPTRDVAVAPEGTKITLGDTTVTVVPTPGTRRERCLMCSR